MSRDSPANVILIPPIFWDRRCMNAIKEPLSDLSYLDKPSATADMNLLEYAQICCERLEAMPLASHYHLLAYGDSAPLAIAMASQLPTTKLSSLLLIAASRTYGSYSKALNRLRSLHQISPGWAGWLYRWRLKQQAVAWKADKFKSDRQLVLAMLADQDTVTQRNELRYFMQWRMNRSELDRLPVPIHQLHGRNDKNFVPPLVQDATLLGCADQQLWFTHPGAVANWISAITTQLEQS